MKQLTHKHVSGVVAFALAALTCIATPAWAEKPLAQRVDLSGATFTVGSKEFTEQLILGQITMQLLQAAGAHVNNQIGMAGSNAVRKALTSGKIDMYWEYTGTGWISYLDHTSANGQAHLYKQVAAQDLKQNGIKWLQPANFSDSYGLVTNAKTAAKYKLKTFSDIGRLIKQHPQAASFCVGNEFSQRDDGLPGLDKTYSWHLPQANVHILQESLVYQQVAQGQRCNFGDVFTTDGRIKALRLVLLQDNKHFFPPYYAALTIRDKVYKRYPQLAKLFRPVSRALTMKTMQELNKEVDVDGKFPQQVAHQFLVSHHFIK